MEIERIGRILLRIICTLVISQGTTADGQGLTTAGPRLGQSQYYVAESGGYSQSIRTKLIKMREEHAEMPKECRRHICVHEDYLTSRSFEYGIGNVNWTRALIGQTAYTRCPFGSRVNNSEMTSYARRKCVLKNGNATWERLGQENFQDCRYTRKHSSIQDLVTILPSREQPDSPAFLKPWLSLANTLSCERSLSDPLIPADLRVLGETLSQLLSTGLADNWDGRSYVTGILSCVLFDIRWSRNLKSANEDDPLLLQRILDASFAFTRRAKLPIEADERYLFVNAFEMGSITSRSVPLGYPDGYLNAEMHYIAGNTNGNTSGHNENYKVTTANFKEVKFFNSSTQPPGHLLETHSLSEVLYIEVWDDNTNSPFEGEWEVTIQVSPSYAGGSKVAFSREYYTGWEFDVCKQGDSPGKFTCNVTLPGYFGAFLQSPAGVEEPPGSIATFWRFKSVYELFVFGEVLRSISLLCLLLTVATLGLFRKLRHGTITNILLNLCASLICVFVLFYATNWIAGTKQGCRISNGLRVYFVLVSLMWNGAEAVNMYLLLIRVFNSRVSRFVLKAGIVAWGVPLLIVCLPLAHSLEMYDGEYEDCVYRCRLRANTLYYVFLVPMGVIILFNIVIFIMVARVIISRGRTSAATKDESSVRAGQVRAAAAMLVLLGVPWVFTAFGSIESSSGLNAFQLAGQIVFILFVCGQGIFIAAFHCLRFPEVWKHWRHLVTTGSTTLPSTATATGVSTLSSAAEKRHTTEHAANTSI